MFCKRILGVGSDDLERVGFKIGVGDNLGMSHPLQFPNVWVQQDSLVQAGNVQRVFPLGLRERYAFPLPYQPSIRCLCRKFGRVGIFRMLNKGLASQSLIIGLHRSDSGLDV